MSEEEAHEEQEFPQEETPETEDGPVPDTTPAESTFPTAETEVEVQQQDTSSALWVSRHDDYALPAPQPDLQHQSPHSQFSGSVNTLAEFSPGRSAGQNHWNPNQITPPILQNVASDAASPIQLNRLSWPIQSLDEARLYHHYIVNLSGQVC